MKRSTPLRRSSWPSKPRPAAARTVHKPLARPANYGPAALKAAPKREYIRSPELLAAVRTLPCMHSGATGGTEPAHSNWGQHGKGRSIKADDNRVAALHRDLHRELDQGSRWSEAERQRIWWNAHVKTVRELLRRGLWPLDVPVPDLRSFNA